MNKQLIVILATVAVDAIGIGLVFPILPRLMEAVTHAQDVAPYIGIMTALYAAMQFLFAPVLGALSDHLGRRPVLIVSIAGAAIDYVVMALAPQFWMLLAGRAVAGLTSANISVATAYITDISPEDARARRFGLSNAMFGAGFIVGPVLGGLLGDACVRLPFLAAAVLNAGNLLLTLFVLPESRASGGRRIDLAALNPLRPLRWVVSMNGLLPIVFVYFLLSAAGEAYGVAWALWGFDTFRWNGFWVGLSLCAFGVCQMLAQSFLPGPATKLLGERGAVVAGIAFSCAALFALAFASRGWMVFAIMPVLALAGIGTPAFQALAARRVGPARQGRLQGVLASAVSFASIVAPLAFSTFYFVVRNQWPGAVWLSAIAINAIAVPLVYLGTPTADPVARSEG